MNKPILASWLALSLSLASMSCMAANGLDALSGKWLVKKSREGQEYSQAFTIKGDKFVFEILTTDNRPVLHAEGDVKLESLGSFNVIRFQNIRAGRSDSDLRDVDDDHAAIYRLDGDTWSVAANFDKDRERQRPSVDVYKRVQTTTGSTLVIDEIDMADTPQSATWFVCFEATVSGESKQYHVAGKGYDKGPVKIPVSLEMPKAEAGQKCTFKLQLDDVEEDVCTEDVDNRSTGEFTINAKGEQVFRPEDHWHYTVRWHLK